MKTPSALQTIFDEGYYRRRPIEATISETPAGRYRVDHDELDPTGPQPVVFDDLEDARQYALAHTDCKRLYGEMK